jgi:hypothetical protein
MALLIQLPAMLIQRLMQLTLIQHYLHTSNDKNPWTTSDFAVNAGNGFTKGRLLTKSR